MPPLKPKPSDVAVEAKKTYIPYINQKFPHLPPRSYFYANSDKILNKRAHGRKLRIAVIDGDPVDVALDWDEYESTRCSRPSGAANVDRPRIPVVNMANERIPGGDWESGLMAPEENFCRRSNLVQCLTAAPSQPNGGTTSGYPLPVCGGVYSPSVVVFRAGADNGYTVWSDFKWLPVISVAPVRRPKLDASGDDYSFEQEKELMKEKIRGVLRIAAAWNHHDLCVGAFGAGPTFRNPVQQLARMWRDVLFSEPEFQGLFSNVVFAIEKGAAPSSSSSKLTEHDVFKQELDPSNVYKTSYR